MSTDLTPMDLRLTALAVRIADLEAGLVDLQRERDHWEHVYRAQQGAMHMRDAELTRLRGKLAVCRCGQAPA